MSSLWRATMLMPLAFIWTFTWLASLVATIALPATGITLFYFGEIWFALLYCMGGMFAFVVSRFLTRKIWERPESLL